MASHDLRRLMQRHEAGDRSPELLRALDRLAWEAFHTPWEPRPEEGQASEAPPEAPNLEWVTPHLIAVSESLFRRGWSPSVSASPAPPETRRIEVRLDPSDPGLIQLHAPYLLVLPGSSADRVRPVIDAWNEGVHRGYYPATLKPDGRITPKGWHSRYRVELEGWIRLQEASSPSGEPPTDSFESLDSLPDLVLKFHIVAQDLRASLQQSIAP